MANVKEKLVPLIPGMVLLGSPYVHFPGNVHVGEPDESGLLTFSGVAMQGELPCATRIEYWGILRKIEFGTYECVSITATKGGVLQTESGYKNFTDLMVDACKVA